MKVAELLESRRRNWKELERLCEAMEHRRKRTIGAPSVVRFASLYRAACADLALADAYQLPPNTVQYLHRLVGRAHNQLYRSRVFDFATWGRTLWIDVPQRIFNDRCVQVAFCMFWGVFIASAALAYSSALWPEYAEQMLSKSGIDGMEEMFKEPVGEPASPMNAWAVSYYIQHNTSIGLKCFASMLFVVPGFLITIFNAALLGASFGYMARPDVPEGENFFHFVTAHGPFELTAIILSAGAGLRLGMAWMMTRGLTRAASLRAAAKEAMPMMGAAMALFFLAAVIEGCLSPSAAPQWTKDLVAIASNGALMFYFVVLGYPRSQLRAA